MLKEDIWWWNITNCGLKPCGTIVKEMWKKKFRMTVEASHYLLGLLVGRKLQKVDTFFKKKAIKVEKSFAVIIWRLSTGNSYRSISK